jgi:hypothetical protein
MGNVRVRQLPVEEWERLRGLPIAARTMPDPERSFILVAEDEGEIVGTWGVVFAPVLEGFWVAPAYRKKSAAAKMWFLMKQTLTNWVIPQALTLVQTEDVADLAEHAGFEPLDGILYSLNLPMSIK